MHRLYANTAPFYMSLEHPWILVSVWVLEQSPLRYWDNCIPRVSFPGFKFFFCHLLVSLCPTSEMWDK